MQELQLENKRSYFTPGLPEQLPGPTRLRPARTGLALSVLALTGPAWPGPALPAQLYVVSVAPMQGEWEGRLGAGAGAGVAPLLPRVPTDPPPTAAAATLPRDR